MDGSIKMLPLLLYTVRLINLIGQEWMFLLFNEVIKQWGQDSSSTLLHDNSKDEFLTSTNTVHNHCETKKILFFIKHNQTWRNDELWWYNHSVNGYDDCWMMMIVVRVSPRRNDFVASYLSYHRVRDLRKVCNHPIHHQPLFVTRVQDERTHLFADEIVPLFVNDHCPNTSYDLWKQTKETFM